MGVQARSVSEGNVRKKVVESLHTTDRMYCVDVVQTGRRLSLQTCRGTGRVGRRSIALSSTQRERPRSPQSGRSSQDWSDAPGSASAHRDCG